MNLIINIPEEAYKQIMEFGFLENTHGKMCYKAIKNGTPIPDNATNGDVIKMMFMPNQITRMDDVVREEYEFNEVWWNALYQKGGKE